MITESEGGEVCRSGGSGSERGEGVDVPFHQHCDLAACDGPEGVQTIPSCK